MSSKGKEAHQCPACGARTYRRIRRMPIQRLIDARCQHCFDKNYRPETVVPYDPEAEQATTAGQAPGAHVVQAITPYELADALAAEAAEAEEGDQGSLLQDSGS